LNRIQGTWKVPLCEWILSALLVVTPWDRALPDGQGARPRSCSASASPKAMTKSWQPPAIHGMPASPGQRPGSMKAGPQLRLAA
jgi:hypothetical protein